jgi:GNAT superfamily N-acetyltransferase
MHIEQVDLADEKEIRACFEVYLAAQRVDEPGGPWFTGRPFEDWLTIGWSGNPREAWLATDQGSAAGWFRLELPDLDNLDQAYLELIVHPAERRSGLGLALLRQAAACAAAHGRTVINGAARDGSAGEAFARWAGAEPGLAEIQRVLDVRQLEQDKLARLHRLAEQAAAAYAVVSWVGLVPDEFIEQAAAVYNAINDAPRDAEIAPEEWTGQRVRERINDLRPRLALRYYTVAARHDGTGELAALTEMAVDPADPGWGHQMFTVVTAKHRGHRLGLLTKIAMLRLLATTEPQLERISTWNARVNEHMIAVNEAIGYTVYRQPVTDYRLDVAAVPRLGPTAQGTVGRLLVAAGRLLGHRDHADDLRLGHAEIHADGQRGVPLGLRKRAVRHGDADHLGQVPLPGLDGELRPDLVQGRADRLERLHQIGVEHGLVVALDPRSDDRLDRPLPRHLARRIARPQHGRDGGPHAGRERRLHLRRGRLAEHLRHVTGAAGSALDVLADRVQRNDREKEQREPPAPRSVPVLPVPAAAAAVEGALRDRPVEHAQAKDDQQRGSPSAYQRHTPRKHPPQAFTSPFRTGKPIMSPPPPVATLPMPIRYLIFRRMTTWPRPKR